MQRLPASQKLGFDVSTYDQEPGVEYAFTSRGPVNLHISAAGCVEPKTSNVVVYIVVDDPDELYREWREAGVAGRLEPPSDTGYGAREGAYVHPDENLMRFASPMA